MSKTKEHYHDEIEKGMREKGRSHKIQWLNIPGYKGETWNPLLGCMKVSEGCKNCYAEKQAFRIAHMGNEGYKKVTNFPDKGWNGETEIVADSFYKPLQWKRPRVIFVCSMGDLFFSKHEELEIDKVFAIAALCPQHIFIILTKRPKQMAAYFNIGNEELIGKWEEGSYEIGIADKNDDIDAPAVFIYNRTHRQWPLKNIWLGVSAENQKQADIRIKFLLETPAVVHGVSIEPMLGSLNLIPHINLEKENSPHPGGDVRSTEGGLDWVICGGESGHKARPTHPDWVRSIRDQCKAANTPFFFKQWGELIPSCQARHLKLPLSEFAHKNVQFQSPHNPDKTNTYFKIGKHKTGNLLDGQKHEQYPNFNPSLNQ